MKYFNASAQVNAHFSHNSATTQAYGASQLMLVMMMLVVMVVMVPTRVMWR